MRDGILSIDNNAAERAMRPLTTGRNNYLFAGSEEGARHAAVMYSLIETCKQHGVNTFDYFRDILTRLPTQKVTELKELLPYHWKPQHAPPD